MDKPLTVNFQILYCMNITFKCILLMQPQIHYRIDLMSCSYIVYHLYIYSDRETRRNPKYVPESVITSISVMIWWDTKTGRQVFFPGFFFNYKNKNWHLRIFLIIVLKKSARQICRVSDLKLRSVLFYSKTEKSDQIVSMSDFLE